MEASRSLTSLIIELLENLADDLAYTLQRLDVLLCPVKLLLQLLDFYSQVLQLRFPLSRFDKLRSVRVEGGLALIFGCHDRGSVRGEF